MLVCVAALGCGDGQGPGPAADPDVGGRLNLPALILSNPSVPGGTTTTGSRATLVDPVVYVSLPPGSLPDAELALFTNLTSGADTTAIVVDGGFDPVPIPAAAGDSLRIRIQLAGQAGERLFYAKVAPRRPPRVVRSSPSAGRSDVPLNSRILIVFSEPLRAESVSDSSVQLLAAGVRVPGSVTFVDATRLSVVFVPAAPLEAGAAYTLVVTGAVTDGDGEPLADPASIRFSTVSGGDVQPPLPPAAPDLPSVGVTEVETVLERVGLPLVPSSRPLSRVVMRYDGQFAIKYYGGPGADTLTVHGWYEYADSTMRFTIQDELGNRSPWEAEATVRSDSLVVRFNAAAQGAGLEGGTYVLTHGAFWQPVAPLPDAREGAKAGAWRGTLYVVGGRNAAGQLAPEILAYDVRQNAWRTAGQLTRPVWSPGLAVVNDRIYVIGGTSTPGEVADVQIFDPSTGTVVAGPPLAFARGRVATAVLDGRIHVMGGWIQGANGGRSLGDHDVLDVATLTWSSRGALPFPVYGFGAAAMAGRIYLALPSNPFYAYDPIRDAWSATLRLAGIWGGGSDAVIDGLLYQTGGPDAWDDCTAWTARLSPNSRELLMLMPTPRCFGAATGLDGALYVIGGVLETNGVLPVSPALTTVERMVLRP